MKKIIVIGLSYVGLNYINYLMNQNNLSLEIGVIDDDRDKVLGHIMDLNHSSILNSSNNKVKVCEYDDCFNADIVVITKMLENIDNYDSLEENTKMVKDITLKVMNSGFNGIFLVATALVDLMTYLVREVSNLPINKVIGTGTIVDTIRLKYLISQKISVNSNNIHAYVIGQHLNNPFSIWSKASIGMVPIKEKINEYDLDAIMIETNSLERKIINYKGENSFAISKVLLKITKSIINDENLILTTSSFYNGVYIGMPSVIGSSGIKGVMKIKLDEEENKKLEQSVNNIKNQIEKMEVLL